MPYEMATPMESVRSRGQTREEGGIPIGGCIPGSCRRAYGPPESVSNCWIGNVVGGRVRSQGGGPPVRMVQWAAFRGLLLRASSTTSASSSRLICSGRPERRGPPECLLSLRPQNATARAKSADAEHSASELSGSVLETDQE